MHLSLSGVWPGLQGGRSIGMLIAHLSLSGTWPVLQIGIVCGGQFSAVGSQRCKQTESILI
jgi:hypothetical protein